MELVRVNGATAAKYTTPRSRTSLPRGRICGIVPTEPTNAYRVVPHVVSNRIRPRGGAGRYDSNVDKLYRGAVVRQGETRVKADLVRDNIVSGYSNVPGLGESPVHTIGTHEVPGRVDPWRAQLTTIADDNGGRRLRGDRAQTGLGEETCSHRHAPLLWGRTDDARERCMKI